MDILIKVVLVWAIIMLVIGCLGYMFGGGSKVYVALFVSDHSELQDTKVVKVIGAFRKKETAEAKLYNHINKHGFDQQATVIECQINKDIFAEGET